MRGPIPSRWFAPVWRTDLRTGQKIETRTDAGEADIRRKLTSTGGQALLLGEAKREEGQADVGLLQLLQHGGGLGAIGSNPMGGAMVRAMSMPGASARMAIGGLVQRLFSRPQQGNLAPGLRGKPGERQDHLGSRHQRHRSTRRL